MAKAKTLAEFQVKIADDGETATLHISDSEGGMLELQATREQLDVIADEIDRMLEATEEADEA
ncbi:hypothetical protein [Aureimonas sp. AU4]|uniref:hypothetical protein n=1 Tax=Aureimonas sp. AU4 TaxID=1638163 RepID=UPI0007814D74|nr:hypothetical protein [Aureimonas sp. AU4]